jgi:hypothetical protein
MVITDDPNHVSPAVLLDEQVHSIHLDSEHSAWQFVERLVWAVGDAEHTERLPAGQRAATALRAPTAERVAAALHAASTERVAQAARAHPRRVHERAGQQPARPRQGARRGQARPVHA